MDLTKPKSDRKKTYIAMVLDRSGSMLGAADVTVRGFNEQVDAIRSKAKDQDVYVSLVTFATDVTEIFWNRRVDELEKITAEDYRPAGTTAYRDAVGYTISKLRTTVDLDDGDTAVLLIIMSDGEENDSHTYSAGDLREMVQTVQGTGKWTITQMGANVSLEDICSQYSIPRGNVTSYDGTPSGVWNAFRTISDATCGYLGARSAGLSSSTGFYDNSDPDNSTGGTQW